MIATATAVLGITLAGIGGTAVEAQVRLRTETSARAIVPEGSDTQSVVSLDVLPMLELNVAGKTRRLSLGYEPQLRASRDLTASASDGGVGHGGTVRAEWDLSPAWRLSAAGRASERLVDFATASAGELTRLLQLGDAPTTLRYGDAGASAGVEGGLTPRLAFASRVGFDSSGGRGAEARAAVPLLRRVRVDAGLARDQTRRDVVRVDAAFLGAEFDAGTTASLATITAGWAHDATRSLRLLFTAGASASRGERAPSQTHPEGRAALEWTPALLGAPMHVGAAVVATAVVDRWREAAYDRVGVDADVSWPASGRWTLRALASRGWARDPVNTTAGRGDLRAAWHASPRVTLSGGAWSEWQDDPALAAAGTVWSWGSTFAVEIAPLGRLAP